MLWAQRSDRLLLTIDLQDCKDPKVSLDNDDKHGKLSFRGNAHSHATGPDENAYVLDLELFGPIDKEDTKISQTDRTILLVIAKQNPEFWPRLLAQAGKTAPNIKVDWDKWVDEDDEVEEEGDKGMGGMGGMPPGFDLSSLQDFSKFGDMGAMGGMGAGDLDAGDDSDDDDDELPELEKA